MKKSFILPVSLCLLALLALTLFFLSPSQKTPPATPVPPTPPNTTNEQGLYQIDDHYFKAEAPLNETSLQNFAKKLNTVQEKYLAPDMRVFYAIAPDKNYYVQDAGYPALDYDKMTTALQENIPNMTYVDLFDLLTLEDYYKTDGHWKQESLLPVVRRLYEAMGVTGADVDFTPVTFPSFYGMYKEDTEETLAPEPLTYWTSAYTHSAVVDNYEQPALTAVYDEAKLSGNNAYDVFLQGASPLITITNPTADSDRELVIFRDSFASSLAPLMLSEYRTITLVDLRYMASQLLPEFLELRGQDVLFLYSPMVINNSMMLK